MMDVDQKVRISGMVLRIVGAIGVGIGIAFGPTLLVIAGAVVAVCGHALSRSAKLGTSRETTRTRPWWADED